MTAPKTIRWWKNGDHPDDNVESMEITAPGGQTLGWFLSPGAVVGHYMPDHYSGDPNGLCPECGVAWYGHGWLGGPKTGTIVHPGDHVTVNKGKHGYSVTRPEGVPPLPEPEAGT